MIMREKIDEMKVINFYDSNRQKYWLGILCQKDCIKETDR